MEGTQGKTGRLGWGLWGCYEALRPQSGQAGPVQQWGGLTRVKGSLLSRQESEKEWLPAVIHPGATHLRDLGLLFPLCSPARLFTPLSRSVGTHAW